ncbi:MAG: Na+/H+ antiporter subunit E [Campylobacterota bacterium]|nr:Na+/H+ antiporter subunit E [Campylobacterota bacterium]
MFSKFILIFIVWVAITNSFDIQELIVGAFVSFGIVYFFTKKDETFELLKTLKRYIAFIPLFLKELIKSNIEVAKIVLSKEIKLNSKVVQLNTSLKEEHQKLLLANSITLTPGTLTLNLKDDILTIHILNPKNKTNQELQKEIIEKFEKKIN